MDHTAHLDDRSLLAVSGPDAPGFLQGLITNDVLGPGDGSSIYAALLTPQGKILFDFLVWRQADTYLLDCASVQVAGLLKRLLLYRLRSRVAVELREDLAVLSGWGGELRPGGATIDPRFGTLGWRAIVPRFAVPSDVSPSATYLRHRLDCGVPEGVDFGQDKIFALDAGLGELHGVSFEKGCYVGQELTARMKHRSTARKRLFVLAAADGHTLEGSENSVTSGGLELGTLVSSYGDRGFALLRLDRLAEVGNAQIEAGGRPVRVVRPPWLSA